MKVIDSFRPRPSATRRLAAILSLLALGWFLARAAQGQSSVIEHEYIPPDPDEDLALGVLMPSGKMPATLRTSSGVVSAPDPFRASRSSSEPTYGARDATGSERFQIDGHTSDPGTLHYHEPFRPSIAPFKRMVAYDAVNDAFELYVRDATTHPVPLEHTPAAGDDEFFGDISLSAGGAVRIPSVAPGMRIVAAELEPALPFQLVVDSAENWFIQAPTLTGTGRLIVRIAANRAALAPEVIANSYTALRPLLPRVPEVVVQAAQPVLEQIGISRVLSPTDAVTAMVAYFRSFTPSNQHFTESPGRELYQRLALSRKGVCRHRAYAFVVTALAIGIPARMVHNEAHAWVEAYDGQQWHRIDLGGAAPSFHFDGERPTGPPYRMPIDRYQWPAHASPAAQSQADRADGAESDDVGHSHATVPASNGAQSTTAADQADAPERDRAQTEPGATDQNQAGVTAATNSALASANTVPSAAPLPSAGATVAADASKVRVQFKLQGQPTVHRGEPVVLQGTLSSDTGDCLRGRVDFGLRRGSEQYVLGATVTDENGHFAISTAVPMSAGIGPYDVTALASETSACKRRLFW